jgi:hypothetical protein
VVPAHTAGSLGEHSLVHTTCRHPSRAGNRKPILGMCVRVIQSEVRMHTGEKICLVRVV